MPEKNRRDDRRHASQLLKLRNRSALDDENEAAAIATNKNDPLGSS